VEFDRRRQVKDALLDRVVAACVVTRQAAWFLSSALGAESEAAPFAPWEVLVVELLRALARKDAGLFHASFPAALRELGQQPLIYRPLSRQGDAGRVLRVETVQQALRELLARMPRLGLIRETCQLLAAAQAMERNQPEGPGAVSQFDRLFRTGYRALVETLVEVSEQWPAPASPRRGSPAPRPPAGSDECLVNCLGRLTESLLARWLLHSHTLRLSALERLADEPQWRQVVTFIEQYGHDLFTPRFLNLGNLRAILHQGAETYLRELAENPEGDEPPALLRDLGGAIRLESAASCLGLIIEALSENYAEYKDYKCTTTQSDRGELLYMLLDFLRLKATYERIAWNLSPVLLAHEILVRRGRLGAAARWQQGLVQRTGETARRLLSQHDELVRRHAMRLRTVADRLEERFERPLLVDRLRALIEPAMREARGGEQRVFTLLEQEIAEFTRKPSGSGLDIPSWLAALGEEVAQVSNRFRRGPPVHAASDTAQVPLTQAEVEKQLESWE
jgi:hypothetical protein